MDTVTSLVLIMGIFITSLFLYGLKLYKNEFESEFKEQREKKLTYRTNEEFIG